jgi:pSer/pThr/pTyr-binding forkhead associated (FHA) protein
MWKLSIEDDQGHKTVVSLLRDEYSIGRSQENTVRLTERNISRRHAILRKNGGAWALEDRSSYNGCFVNGVRVAEPRALSNGDLVQLGDYRLEMVDDSAVVAAEGGAVAAPTAVGTLTGQPDRLVMVVGPTPGAEFALDQERIVIGRGEECDVAISHGSVSRVHAEIRQLGDGRFELIDRESANGVRVNGIELGRALLDARDVIELGDIVFKFIPAGEVYRPSSHELKRLGPLSQEPATAVPVVAPVASRAAWTPAVKIAGVAALVVLAVLVGVFAMSERRSGVQTAPGAATDDAVKILGVAKAALDRGEVEKAHTLAINGVPESSNARHAPDFLEIEARWADLMFAKADRETDRDKKRALLDQIATATSVDSARRKRAADMIAELTGAAAPTAEAPVEVAEAPKPSKAGARAPVAPSEPPARPATQAVAAKRPAAAAPAPEPAEAPAPPPKSATEKKSTSGSTVVTDQATSGDRARQIAAKDALKAKVAGGHASEQDRRLLRALCRQFSDPSCSN